MLVLALTLAPTLVLVLVLLLLLHLGCSRKFQLGRSGYTKRRSLGAMICALHARTPAPGLCRPLQTPLRRYLYCRCVMLGPTRSRCRRVLDIAALTRLHRHVCHRVPLSHRVACTPTQLHMILIPRSTEPTTAATGHRGTRVALVVGAAVRSHRCPALLRARAAPTSIGCHRMPCMRCLHQLKT